jgi:hypothetical protein
VAENSVEVNRALIYGADEAILYPFKPEELIALISGLCKEPKRQCDLLAKQLRELKPGLVDAYKLEELIVEILTFLFSNEISYLGTQTISHRAIPIRLFVFQNYSMDNFWRALQVNQDCDRIIFANRSKSRQYSIEHLLDALDIIGFWFGILIYGQESDVDQVVCPVTIQRMGVTLQTLSLAHLRTLLAYKAAGVDPVSFIQDLWQI